MFDIDRPEITSASHPEEAYWYNDPDALFEWASGSMPPAVSAWRFRLSENEPHTGDLTDGNSQLLGADITTLDLPDRAHGRRWLTLAPVDAKGEIINQRKKSFNFNVNRKAPIVGSPSHPNQSVPGILRTVLVYWSSPDVSAGSHPFYFYVWTRDSADSPTMEDNMASTTTRAFFSQPPGSHYFHVVGVDRLGNLTEPGRFRVSIDEITGPPAGTRIPDPPVARVPASVGDNHFWAVWDHADGAQGYRLDIATDVNFENILPAYDDLDVGNVTVHHVTGLEPESTYYFRLRSYSDQGTSSHSNAVSVTTQPEFIFAHYAEYLYLVALDRYPGEGVAETWQEGYYEYFFIEGNLDIRLLPQDVGRILFDSSEYAGRGRTCEEFIDDIYRAFLFRRANDFELHVWCREAVGWNRAEVMGIIARSEESYSAITRLLPERDGGGDHPSGSRNFAAIMYVGILDRLPEHGGLDFWDGYLEAEPDKAEAAISMARSLFHSDEFLDNLPANQTEAAEATVVHMYRAFLNRWPMTPEIQFWAGELSGGRETMDSMIDFFARSDEFAEKVDQFFRD